MIHMRLQIVAMLLVGLSIMLIFSVSFCSGWFYCLWLIEGVVASNKRDGSCSLCRIEAKRSCCVGQWLLFAGSTPLAIKGVQDHYVNNRPAFIFMRQ